MEQDLLKAAFGDRPPDIDLGDEHYLWYYQWSPNRELNPQYHDLPDVPKMGAVIVHRAPSGKLCWSGINFKIPGMERVFPDNHTWQVQSWDPLTLTPSILCKVPMEGGGECGDHGFITNGRWVKA